jgi:outer membrane PBP1 activator LpoA protein
MPLPLKTYCLSLLATVALGLAGCASDPAPVQVISQVAAPEPTSIEGLLASAQTLPSPAAEVALVTAIELMLQTEQSEQAPAAIARINQAERLPSRLQYRIALIQADIALRQNQPQAAMDWLTSNLINTDVKDSLLNTRLIHLQANALRETNQAKAAFETFMVLPTAVDTSNLPGLHDDIWASLQQLDQSELNDMAGSADSYNSLGWIELAKVIDEEQHSIKAQLDAIARWRRVWARHPTALALPGSLLELQLIWDQRPKHIVLLLPLQNQAGNAIQEGFFSAYYQALSVSREVPRITIIDSSNSANVNPLYDNAVALGPDLIIGPLDKELVNQLQQRPDLPVPTLALNYADSTKYTPVNLYQFGLAPEDEIIQAASMAWQAGHRNAAIVTPRSNDDQRLQSIFSNEWERLGGTLVSTAAFSGDSDYSDVIKQLMAIDSSEARASRLMGLLPRSTVEFIPRRRNDIDFIFLIANPLQGRQLKPTLAFHFAGDIPVYAMPSIYGGFPNQSENRDLNGIIFTDAPWILDETDPVKVDIANNLRFSQGPLQRLRAMGMDSFRIYPRLQQLANGKLNALQGTTGSLSMSDQRIQRVLQAARFVDGLATAIE